MSKLRQSPLPGRGGRRLAVENTRRLFLEGGPYTVDEHHDSTGVDNWPTIPVAVHLLDGEAGVDQRICHAFTLPWLPKGKEHGAR